MSIKTTVKGTLGDDSLFILLLKDSAVHLCSSKCQLSPGFSLHRNDRGALPRQNKSRQPFQMIFLSFFFNSLFSLYKKQHYLKQTKKRERKKDGAEIIIQLCEHCL